MPWCLIIPIIQDARMIWSADFSSPAFYLLKNCLFSLQASVLQIPAICGCSTEHTNKFAQGHKVLPQHFLGFQVFFFPECLKLLIPQIPDRNKQKYCLHWQKVRYLSSSGLTLKSVSRAPYASIICHAIDPHLYTTEKYNAFHSKFLLTFIPTNYNLFLYLILPKSQSKTLFIKKDPVLNDLLRTLRQLTQVQSQINIITQFLKKGVR